MTTQPHSSHHTTTASLSPSSLAWPTLARSAFSSSPSSTGVPQRPVVGPLLVAIYTSSLKPVSTWLGFPYLCQSRGNPLFCQKALEDTVLPRALALLTAFIVYPVSSHLLSPFLIYIPPHCLSEALHCWSLCLYSVVQDCKVVFYSHRSHLHGGLVVCD